METKSKNVNNTVEELKRDQKKRLKAHKELTKSLSKVNRSRRHGK
jgi:hypothetical protein